MFYVKALIFLFLCATLAVGAFFVCIKMKIISNPFEVKESYILETPAVVREIKSIAELYSVCYYDQLIADSTRKEIHAKDAVFNFFGRKSTTDYRLILMASGKVFAGFDLSKLDFSDIHTRGDSIYISLPAVRIIDIVMNPSDVVTFVEEGQWSAGDVKAVKNKALASFRKRALQKGILADAEKKGKGSIEMFFRSLGFKQVVFNDKIQASVRLN